MFKASLLNPAKPHLYININLKSNIDLPTIIGDLTKLIPQFGGFIEQFNTLISENSVNVFTDSQGNLFIDVPDSMPEDKSNQISNKVNILDRLIKTQSESIKSLFEKGSNIESKFKTNNSNYASELSVLRKSFQTFGNSYKH